MQKGSWANLKSLESHTWWFYDHNEPYFSHASTVSRNGAGWKRWYKGWRMRLYRRFQKNMLRFLYYESEGELEI